MARKKINGNPSLLSILALCSHFSLLSVSVSVSISFSLAPRLILALGMFETKGKREKEKEKKRKTKRPPFWQAIIKKYQSTHGSQSD